MMEKKRFKHWAEVLVSMTALTLMVSGFGCKSSNSKTPTEGSSATVVRPSDGLAVRKEIEILPTHPIDGSLVRIVIHSAGAPNPKPSVNFNGKSVPVYATATDWEALIGIPYGTSSSEMPLDIEVSGQKSVVMIPIHPGQYPFETLSVPPKTVTLSAKDQKRVDREYAEVGALYRVPSEEKLWQGSFRYPIKGKIVVKSEFGTSRVYNGKKNSPHQGVDLQTGFNRPIEAPETGRVKLAKNLFLTGNTVILDHGFGVFTVYCHMNKLKVKVGDILTPGQVMGLSGMTGRANGPHLHWGAVVQGVKVNPLDLLKAWD